jgi:hypothetical protein
MQTQSRYVGREIVEMVDGGDQTDWFPAPPVITS